MLELKKRYELTGTVRKIFEYEKRAYCSWNGMETWRIYIIDTQEGVVKVNTSSNLGLEGENERGDYTWTGIKEGHTVTFKATVKDFTEYNGEEQILVQRVKVSKITGEGESYQEKMARLEREKEQERIRKQNEQLDSLKEDDDLLVIPYRTYKNHYSDCETIFDSYNPTEKTIGVIVRAGRMKNSGVRGKKYKYFLFEKEGEFKRIKAMSLENAERQLRKAKLEGYNFYKMF